MPSSFHYGHIGAQVDMVDGLGGMAGGGVGVDHGLDERVGGQAVAAVQAGARALAKRVEMLDAALAVEVDLDAAAEIVGGGRHGDIVLGDVYAEAETLGVDVGEVAACLLGVLVGDVEEHVVVAVLLHLAVDGAGHDVARGQAQARVILVHELLAAQVAQHGAVAAHGLGDEELGRSPGW